MSFSGLSRLRSWLEGLNAVAWVLLQSVLAVVAVAGAQIVITELARPHKWGARLGLGSLLIIGAVIYFWLILAASRVRDRVFPKHPALVLALQRELDRAFATENHLFVERGRSKKQRHVDAMASFMRAVQRAISDQWAEARFGTATQTEVVLMTKSLRDHALTCASWAVRQPFSLARREHDQTVYAHTEAARMYEAAERGRLGTRVISDTSAPEIHYEFLNTSETERIRSTALHPVYDDQSQLIGVVVAHTNRPKVLKNEDLDFWSAFFRLVEPHVARRILLATDEEWNNDAPW
jgi:GAF domain-containing protein